MWKYIIGIVLLIPSAYFLIQGIRCAVAVKAGRERLTGYNAETACLHYGNMTYVDRGEGPVILSVHGIFGGYDQAFDTCKEFASDFRILAPSRFGYLGSEIAGNGTPAEQAKAYAALLDYLNIDKVYVLATSSGGSVAIQFALDYPERTNGLILYCSAVPPLEKPEKAVTYAGPPAFLCSDYAMFLISPLFEPILGMKSATIYSMLPIGERKAGVVLDASVTNPDMERNFEEYPVEKLQIPVLVLLAKDDKLVDYAKTEQAIRRFPNCTFLSFENGGHLMASHEEEIREAVFRFTQR